MFVCFHPDNLQEKKNRDFIEDTRIGILQFTPDLTTNKCCSWHSLLYPSVQRTLAVMQDMLVSLAQATDHDGSLLP